MLLLFKPDVVAVVDVDDDDAGVTAVDDDDLTPELLPLLLLVLCFTF